MDELIELIRTHFRAPITLGSQTPLISSGVIDSLQFTELLLVLEKKYQRPIDLRDVGVDNFDTPTQMLQYVKRDLP